MAEPSAVSLVEATMADSELLISYMQQLRRDENVQQHACADDLSMQKALHSLITNPDLGRIWIIRLGEMAVGYAALVFSHSLEFAGQCGLLDEFFIQQEHRGQGIGKAALAWICESAASVLGVRAIFLEVSPGNAAAQGLYRSAGFAQRPYNFMFRSTFRKMQA